MWRALYIRSVFWLFLEVFRVEIALSACCASVCMCVCVCVCVCAFILWCKLHEVFVRLVYLCHEKLLQFGVSSLLLKRFDWYLIHLDLSYQTWFYVRGFSKFCFHKASWQDVMAALTVIWPNWALVRFKFNSPSLMSLTSLWFHCLKLYGDTIVESLNSTALDLKIKIADRKTGLYSNFLFWHSSEYQFILLLNIDFNYCL